MRDVAIGLSEPRFVKLKRFFGRIVRSPGVINGQRIPEHFFITEDFLRHIFTGRLKIYAKKLAQMNGELSGFHHSYKWNDLQKKLFRFANMEVDIATGVTASWISAGGLKLIEKTMFPAHWSPEKVVEKLIEALGNLEEVIEVGNRFRITGRTKCGVIVRFVSERSGHLSTAFPILDAI